MKRIKEPERLRKGKIFHKKIEQNWIDNGAGIINTERTILKKNHRKGRVDVFVDDEDPDGNAAIIEIKATDWDRMTEKAVRRNIRRHVNQIWGYIESQILNGEYVPKGVKKSISPGIVFPKKPKDESRLKLIEETFIDNGIAVVWEDESLEECRRRNGLSEKGLSI